MLRRAVVLLTLTMTSVLLIPSLEGLPLGNRVFPLRHRGLVASGLEDNGFRANMKHGCH